MSTSDFLFAKPSFIDGVASVIDLFGMLPDYNESEDAQASDARAMRADCLALQSDAHIAFQTVIASCTSKTN